MVTLPRSTSWRRGVTDRTTRTKPLFWTRRSRRTNTGKLSACCCEDSPIFRYFFLDFYFLFFFERKFQIVSRSNVISSSFCGTGLGGGRVVVEWWTILTGAVRVPGKNSRCKVEEKRSVSGRVSWDKNECFPEMSPMG